MNIADKVTGKRKWSSLRPGDTVIVIRRREENMELRVFHPHSVCKVAFTEKCNFVRNGCCYSSVGSGKGDVACECNGIRYYANESGDPKRSSVALCHTIFTDIHGREFERG